ncbi:hypothetical protein BDF14DRAFT_1969237, partial [Spinellus fusiger]
MSSDEINALLKKIKALETAQSNDRQDLFIVEHPNATDLVPYPALLAAFPEIENNFFCSPLDETKCRLFIHNCPRNPLWQYSAPPLNCNETGAFTKRHNGQLSDIQYHLSGIMWPIDLFIHGLVQGNSHMHNPHIVFAKSVHALLADIGSHITQILVDNVCHDTGLTPYSVATAKDAPPAPLLDANKVLKQTFMSHSLRDAICHGKSSQLQKGNVQNDCSICQNSQPSIQERSPQAP